MRILIIGGSGTISTAVVDLLARHGSHELFVLNRGRTPSNLPSGVTHIKANAFDEDSLAEALDGMEFDVVATFVAKKMDQLIPTVNVLSDHMKQFIFISSASAYQKPVRNWHITEDTPLKNPYWQYSRDKIECENYLFQMNRLYDFPVTVVRPSHTYCERAIPMGMHGKNGTWQIAKRMIEGKPVIIHGDGTSLWTMTDSRDFARAFVGLMGNDKAIGEAFHITSDESITWNQIYEDIADALSAELGRKIKLNACHVTSDKIISEGHKFGYDLEGNLLGDKSNSVVFDNSKVKSLVPGFKAKISHKEGTRRAVHYVLTHPECQKEDPGFDAFCDHLASL